MSELEHRQLHCAEHVFAPAIAPYWLSLVQHELHTSIQSSSSVRPISAALYFAAYKNTIQYCFTVFLHWIAQLTLTRQAQIVFHTPPCEIQVSLSFSVTLTLSSSWLRSLRRRLVCWRRRVMLLASLRWRRCCCLSLSSCCQRRMTLVSITWLLSSPLMSSVFRPPWWPPRVGARLPSLWSPLCGQPLDYKTTT